jgi:hypothetical protein
MKSFRELSSGNMIDELSVLSVILRAADISKLSKRMNGKRSRKEGYDA